MKARGVALLMGLVLLAAISLLAVMAANGMVLQKRMASNFGDRGLALENAQLAAAAARAWLDSRADFEREAACVTSCLLPPAIHRAGDLPPDLEFESAEWWRSNAVLSGTHPESGAALGAFGAPGSGSYWLVEEVHFEPLALAVQGPAVGGIGYYRILGRGSGQHPGSVAVSETIVARPWEGDYQPADFPVPAAPGGFCQQFDPAVPCGTLAWRQRK